MWFGVLGRLEIRGSDGMAVPISGPARANAQIDKILDADAQQTFAEPPVLG